MANSKEWKIYTRKGDTGKTSLIGGARVPKHHNRVECYGTIDELNAVMGMLRDQSEAASFGKELLKIQETLFTLESQIACAPEHTGKDLPQLEKSDLVFLEHAIDRMNKGLPELKYFILPGGHPTLSWAHIARTVCRRAERSLTRLAEEEKVEPLNISYLNRLSDFLFVLSRRIACDLKVTEAVWNPDIRKKE